VATAQGDGHDVPEWVRTAVDCAGQLVLSERTVETHVRSILAKLGYSTRTEIATWSLRRA
jgi:DNA-binding NarL/FixJ family response regulator